MNRHNSSQSETQQTYDALLSALNKTALVSITDKKGRITYANDRFVEVSKYQRSELIGQNHRILKSGDQPDRIFVDMWKTISRGNIWRGEIKNKAKDGSYYWVDTSISPIMDKHNKPERYIAVRFDITEQKEAERKKQEQRHQLQEAKLLDDAILQSIADGLLTTDKNMIITMVNRAFERLTGLKKETVIGKCILDIVHLEGEDGKKISDEKRPMRMALKDKKRTLIKASQGYYYHAGSQRFPVALSVSPVIRNDEVVGTVQVFRDITQEKQIDKAKSEFVSLASHQLRTPLTAISWYTDMILAGDAGAVTDEQNNFLQEIQEGNKRMIELVNSLLNVSRIELGTFIIEPQSIDLTALCKTIIKDNKPQIIEQGVTVQENYELLPSMKLDPKLTRIVIENLLSNAIKYSPQKGRITLSVTKTSRYAVVQVSDEGYGIPKSQQDKIFTKLFRADNVKTHDTEGTGLGLYIAKSVIDAAGGTINFVSRPTKGTTFTVKIPLSGMKRRKGTRKLD